MMKNINSISRFAAFAMVTLATVLAHAHNGNNGNVTLSLNYQLWTSTYDNNTIRVVLNQADYYNPAGCPTANGNIDSYMVSTTMPAEARQRIYSTLLAAKLAGKQVVLNIDTASCEQNKPKIRHVTIE